MVSGTSAGLSGDADTEMQARVSRYVPRAWVAIAEEPCVRAEGDAHADERFLG